jgi:hypothetical protein
MYVTFKNKANQIFFVGNSKIIDEKGRIRIRQSIVRKCIQIRTNMSRIHNTGFKKFLCFSPLDRFFGPCYFAFSLWISC